MLEAAVMCLAMNAYWEARNQDISGMIAVSQVVMNRVESEYYPDNPCSVITQGPEKPSWKDPNIYYPVRHKCQFSWYCDGKSDDIPPYDYEAIHNAFSVAQILLDERITVVDITKGATHYHANYVNPDWAETKEKTVEIDDHIFYKWD
jgi:spore germination cell wall hydrolase CwlJ-like protein